MRKPPPAWFLFFFAPLAAEYVSGSSPYLNPFVWVANFFLYGAGTLLIHELRVRWKKGWLAVFILAAAYMIAEEGLMLNTLFDPTQNTAGRALGVNWVWTTGMLMVHSLVSILAPLLLTEAIYDEQANQPWLTPRACFVLLAAFLANVFGLGRLIAPANRPSAIYWLIEGAIIAGCLWLAWSINEPRLATDVKAPPRSPLRIFLGTLFGMTFTMIVGFAAPSLPIPAAVKVAAMLAAYLGFLERLRRKGTFSPDTDRLTRFAVACGIISFWILVSPLKSVASRNAGPAFFGALVAVFLVTVLRRLRQAPSCALS